MSFSKNTCFSNEVNARCEINHSYDNWYCHNLCNYSKLDQWNNHIFSRHFPQNQLPLVLETRPSFKWCMDTYVTQPSGTLDAINRDEANVKLTPQNNIVSNDPIKSIKPVTLNMNLKPYRNDRDCYFCRILNSLMPDKGDALQYLRKMDIDSYVKGLTHYLTKCSEYELNANCINANLDKDLCPTCKESLEIEPSLVKYINRWNPCGNLEKCYQFPKDTTDTTFKPNYFYGCPIKPAEFVWNNRTKRLDQYPKTPYCSKF